ncbi:hypothetical protein BG00_02315 [Pseudoalteromonas sp. SCSIO_11900]|nr:hypothetical protein BG00_02315 [Pseudoalteromonas sp. SCSIO_11900]
MATRWRSPPERADGLWLLLCARPTLSSMLSAFLLASFALNPFMSNGMATFSTALNSINKWWN